MKQCFVPWANWYGNTEMELLFPEEWPVELCGLQQSPALSSEELASRLAQPIGSPSLSQLAKGKTSACIVVDDISRPTRLEDILPLLVAQLTAAGIAHSHITVLIALGAHRTMTRQDIVKKMGSEIPALVQVLNHSPFADDLAELVDEETGQTVQVNRHFAQAELRIAVGCIVPHTLAGFSGGAKAVIPGIGGIKTLHGNHSLAYGSGDDRSFANNALNPDNPLRRNMEKMVGRFGLDFIVNVVLNQNMEAAGLFAGHYVDAHRAACQKALIQYETPLVKNADVVVLNTFPKDTEYSQIGTAFAVLGAHKERCVKPGGTIVLATAASEGGGFHALFGPGMGLFTPHDDNIPPAELRDREVLLFAPGLHTSEIRQFYKGEPPPLYGNWAEVLAVLQAKHTCPTVAVYPMGSLQIGRLPQGTG